MQSDAPDTPRPRRVRRCGSLTAFTTVLWLLLGAVAAASFTASVAGSQDFGTAVLQPATSLSAAGGTCTADQSDSIVLSWTASTSGWGEGYEVLRSTDGSTYSVIATLSGVQTESYTDSSLSFTTTYHYRVQAKKLEWRSQVAEVSRTTRASTCLA